MKRSTVLPWFSRVIVLLTLIAPSSFAQKITTFDFPGGIATTPTGISSSGRIVGYYGDQKAVAVRGFVRNAGGKFTPFDAPDSTYTLPTGVNSSEQIVGFYGEYFGYSYTQLGFLRNPDGTMATFSSGTGAVTSPEDINALGQVVGYWQDFADISHGFLRNPDGTITSFDVVSGGFSGTGTIAVAINALGQSTGSFLDIQAPGDTAFCGRLMGRSILLMFQTRRAPPGLRSIKEGGFLAATLTPVIITAVSPASRRDDRDL